MAEDLRLKETDMTAVSPLFWPPPKGQTFDAVVGGLESSDFLRQSRVIAEAWAKGGTRSRYEEIAGTDHFTVLDALSDPQLRDGEAIGGARPARTLKRSIPSTRIRSGGWSLNTHTDLILRRRKAPSRRMAAGSVRLVAVLRDARKNALLRTRSIDERISIRTWETQY